LTAHYDWLFHEVRCLSAAQTCRGIRAGQFGEDHRNYEEAQKTIIFTTMVWGAKKQGKIFRKLKQSYLEPYPTPEKAATVLAHLVRYSEYLGVARGK
jgi:acyl-CoA synthetase (NDP forming)